MVQDFLQTLGTIGQFFKGHATEEYREQSQIISLCHHHFVFYEKTSTKPDHCFDLLTTVGRARKALVNNNHKPAGLFDRASDGLHKIRTYRTAPPV